MESVDVLCLGLSLIEICDRNPFLIIWNWYELRSCCMVMESMLFCTVYACVYVNPCLANHYNYFWIEIYV